MNGAWLDHAGFVAGVVLVTLGAAAVLLGVLILCGRRAVWPKVYLISTLMGGGEMPGGLAGRFVASNITDGTLLNLAKCLALAALGAAVSLLGAHLCMQV